MSYRRSAGPFGYDMVVELPGVGQQHIIMPLEQMVTDAGDVAIERARTTWLPPVMHDIEQEFSTNVMPQIRQMMDDASTTILIRVAILGCGLLGAFIVSQRIAARNG